MEWNTSQPHPATLASDDGFFPKINANHGNVRDYINNQTTPAYQQNQHLIPEAYAKEGAVRHTHSAEFNATLFKNNQISDSAFATA